MFANSVKTTWFKKQVVSMCRTLKSLKLCGKVHFSRLNMITQFVIGSTAK